MKKVMIGTVCATITPFTKDGAVDYASLKSFCRYLGNTEIDCLYPLGTNGEGITLSQDEKKNIIDVYMQELGGKKPVSIQCGGATLKDTLEIVAYAKASGADAAGIITPYFFNQSERALYDYYSAIAKAAEGFPLYIYNIPPNSNDDIAPETVAKLAAEFDNIVGIKYSFPNLMRIQDYIRAKEGFDVLIGCDRLFLPTLSLGGAGTVSGPAVIYDKLFSKIYHLAQQGDYAGALEVQRKIEQQDRELACYPGIPLLKIFLKKNGIIAEDTCRAPFQSISLAEQDKMMQIISRYID